MKSKLVVFLLIGLLTLIGCRKSSPEEQTPIIDQSPAEIIEGTAPGAGITPDSLPELPAQAIPDAEIIATLQLQSADGDNVVTHDFGITDYVFFDGSLDEWLGSTPADVEPLVALGKILTLPYTVAAFQIEEPIFEPVWVAIDLTDTHSTVLFWEESAGGELLEAIPIYQTIPVDESANLTTLLQTRNEYYLPQADGILWIEKLLLKNGEMYYFAPDTTVVANAPYTFTCDDTTSMCVWAHHFKIGVDAYYELELVYEQPDFLATIPGNEYWTSDDHRQIYCNFQEGVCYEKPVHVPEYEFSCEYDLLGDPTVCTKTYRDLPDSPQVFKAVTAQAGQWQRGEPVSGYVDWLNGYLCNETRQECFLGSRIQDFGLPDHRDYVFECDAIQLTCIFTSVYNEPAIEFELLITQPEWAEDYASTQTYWSIDSQYSYICHVSTQSCWNHQTEKPQHRLLECIADSDETVNCYFEQINTGEQLSVPLVFDVSNLSFSYMEFFRDGFACDWNLNICYDWTPYEDICSILTWECNISHRYFEESLTYTFTHDPDELGEEYVFSSGNVVCDFERQLCSYPLGGGGTTQESQRCFRLNCPNGFWCSLTRYNQYQCYLYNTPRPRP